MHKILVTKLFGAQFWLTFLILLLSFSSFSQRPGIPQKPNPPTLVNNYSKEFPDFISSSQQAELEEKLQKFAMETSNQIVVIIIDDLAGYEPWDFATELGQQWSVGQEKEDNGIVILIKPTGGQGQRKTHIAVGRGLEGAIPDYTAKEIVERELISNFKNGSFYEGINASIDVLSALSKGEYNHKDYKKKGENNGMAIVIIIIIIIIIIVKFGPKGGGGSGNGWTYGAAGFMAGRSFGGGSSTGGGFGGFGGGSFGGGGAGGSW
jgi:uncharacterized protein